MYKTLVIIIFLVGLGLSIFTFINTNNSLLSPKQDLTPTIIVDDMIVIRSDGLSLKFWTYGEKVFFHQPKKISIEGVFQMASYSDLGDVRKMSSINADFYFLDNLLNQSNPNTTVEKAMFHENVFFKQKNYTMKTRKLGYTQATELLTTKSPVYFEGPDFSFMSDGGMVYENLTQNVFFKENVSGQFKKEP